MCSINKTRRSANEGKCMCNKQNSYNTVIKSCCILYFLLLLSPDIQSQDPCDKIISGRVFDTETNKPLPDVIVRAISNPRL